MKRLILFLMAFIGAIYIFLVIAVDEDMRWFQQFSQSACNRNKPNSNLSEVLKGDCFWDRTGENGVMGGLNSCYRFLPNGKCYFYYYNFYNHRVTDSVFRYEADDVIIPATWTSKSDTVLIARGTPYKVISFGENFVVVEGNFKDTVIFRKNCQTVLER